MSEAPGDPGLYGRGRSDGQGANPAPEAFSHRGSLTPPNPTPHRRRKAPTRCERGVSTRCILNERWPNGERRTPRGCRKPAAVPGRGDEAGSEGTRRRVCPGAGRGQGLGGGCGKGTAGGGTEVGGPVRQPQVPAVGGRRGTAAGRRGGGRARPGTAARPGQRPRKPFRSASPLPPAVTLAARGAGTTPDSGGDTASQRTRGSPPAADTEK